MIETVFIIIYWCCLFVAVVLLGIGQVCIVKQMYDLARGNRGISELGEQSKKRTQLLIDMASDLLRRSQGIADMA